jgi:hypothetical protein
MSIELAPNGLPQSSQWLFPEYDFARMKVNKYSGVIMERIINRGSWAEIRWMLDTYPKREIAKWVRAHGYRRLDRRAFAYWINMLGIKRYKVPPWERSESAFRAWKRKEGLK